MAYWDTSCLLKLYANEADSPLFQAYTVKDFQSSIAYIGRMELWAALRRKETLGEILPGAARTALVAFDTDVPQGLLR